MGVVPEDEDGLPVQDLEPAGDLGDRPEPLGHLGRRHPEVKRYPRRRKRVLHVEPTDERELHEGFPVLSAEPEASAVGKGLHGLGSHLEAVAEPRGHDLARRGPEGVPRRLVAVDDQDAVGREQLREPKLRLTVAGHLLVIIQVLAAEAREGRVVEAEAVDTTLIERVRRDLHRRQLHAVVTQDPQRAGQNERIRRRQLSGVALAARIHDPESPEGGGAAETGEKMPDQPGGRRLAVRARDADQPHPGGRIAFTQHGEVGERDAGVGDDELRQVQVGGAFHDRGRRSRPSGLPQEGVAVGPESGERYEEISRTDEARIR